MGRYLNVGNDGFRAIRKGRYVDKTGLISFINETLGTADKLTCVSRARRFGKSFAVKMLCAYYDKSCDSNELFDGLEIAEDPSYRKYLNKYDVIYLDMTLFISLCGNMKDIMAYIQEQVIQEIADVYPAAVGEEHLSMAMAKASASAGIKFIVIIDEWDALFREAKNDTDLQKEYIRLLRGLFKSSLTDSMIEAAYMTGILPIKKYGTQSAMTDFREYTMLSPKRLAKYAGFTETEVRQLCEDYGMDYGEAKRWYDGYSFKNVPSVYNPNAIMRAMQNQEFGSYWTETETYEALKIYIDMDFDGLREAILSMLGGEKCPVNTGTFQNDLTSLRSRDDVMVLLIHLGYLAYDGEAEKVYIPNEEIRQEFFLALKHSGHWEIAKLVKESDELLRAALNLNGEKVADAIEKMQFEGYGSEVLLVGISYDERTKKHECVIEKWRK